MTKASIIVVTYNRIKYFKTFIKFLYRSTKVSFKLIVVDNGSIDGTRDYIKQLKKDGKIYDYVFTKNNIPLAQALNEGFKLVDTVFVVTVADDMVVNPELKNDWLEIFIAKMEQDETIGCINFVGSRCCHDKFLKRYDK